MLDFNHYMPILKGKMGEFKALAHLTSQIRRKFIPFIDIPRPDNNSDHSFDQYLLNKAKYLNKYWEIDAILFVDYFDLDLSLRTSSGQHFIDFSFNNFRKYDIKAIPVTGLDRDAEYNTAIAKTINKDKRGVLIRLQKYDIEDPSSTLKSIQDLLSDLGLKNKDVHLLLDLRNLQNDEVIKEVDDVIDFLLNFGELSRWKSIFLGASGFPENMGGIQKNSFSLIPRTELDLWEQVVIKGKKKKLDRFPAFSDYGICHPDLLDFDITMTPSANIRYTLLRDWLIVRGTGLKKKIGGRTFYDFDQFFELANQLTLNSNYCGSGYSYGDKYIYYCSERSKGPGNLTTWREVGTNHHLTLVTEQIANCHVI